MAIRATNHRRQEECETFKRLLHSRGLGLKLHALIVALDDNPKVEKLRTLVVISARVGV